MISTDILQPVVALLAWTMVMWVWMYATRIPAMNTAGIDAKNLVGSDGASLRAKLPDTVSWKADNYNHLHEAPTVFYAVALAYGSLLLVAPLLVAALLFALPLSAPHYIDAGAVPARAQSEPNVLATKLSMG